MSPGSPKSSLIRTRWWQFHKRRARREVWKAIFGPIDLSDLRK